MIENRKNGTTKSFTTITTTSIKDKKGGYVVLTQTEKVIRTTGKDQN